MSSAIETLDSEGLADEPAPAAVEVPAGPPLTVIERRRGWVFVDTGELWRYRELLYFLAWRDVKVRYKQTALGAVWAVLQPLATMVAFAAFLGPVVAGRSVEAPYPLYVFAGLLPWTFFAGAVTSAAQSIVSNQSLVTKVYFPRLIIPVAAVGAMLVDLLVSFGLLLVLMRVYGRMPGQGLLLAPAVLLGLTVAATGVGAILAALTVAYRDFRYVVPFLVQFWMFATPIIYLQADAIGPRWRAVLPLNPAYGFISAFRRATLGGPIDGYALAVSGAASAALFLAGLLYFRRVERSFSDII
jgi:lipopolysaccharide transport system permease protein